MFRRKCGVVPFRYWDILIYKSRLLDHHALVLIGAPLKNPQIMMLGNVTPIPRRTFFAYGLAAGWAASRSFAESSFARNGAVLQPVNSFSRLKKKLAEGESATLLIISDSTGYRDISAVRQFIRWLAAQYPAQRASEWYWAEWVTNAPTGPRNYGEPSVISEGTTKVAFTSRLRINLRLLAQLEMNAGSHDAVVPRHRIAEFVVAAHLRE